MAQEKHRDTSTRWVIATIASNTKAKKKGMGQIAPNTSETAWTSDMLITDFYPPELWQRNDFAMLQLRRIFEIFRELLNQKVLKIGFDDMTERKPWKKLLKNGGQLIEVNQSKQKY